MDIFQQMVGFLAPENDQAFLEKNWIVKMMVGFLAPEWSSIFGEITFF